MTQPSAAQPAAAGPPAAQPFVQGRERSRPGLALWFVLQWILLPLDLAWRLALLLVLLVVPYEGMSGPAFGLGAAWARRLGPSRLAREWSRDPARWEDHLRGRFAVVDDQLRKAAADADTVVDFDGKLRPVSSLQCWYLGRDDFGTLPFDRIRHVAAAAGQPGWQPAGPAVWLPNPYHRPS